MATLEFHTEVALRREAWRPAGKRREAKRPVGKYLAYRCRPALHLVVWSHQARLDPGEDSSLLCSC